jgi:hypothetical protein
MPAEQADDERAPLTATVSMMKRSTISNSRATDANVAR